MVIVELSAFSRARRAAIAILLLEKEWSNPSSLNNNWNASVQDCVWPPLLLGDPSRLQSKRQEFNVCHAKIARLPGPPFPDGCLRRACDDPK